jgi:cytochrome c
MEHRTNRKGKLLAVALLAGLGFASAALAANGAPPAVDAAAAKALALDNSCLRCHGVHKKKEGPTYAEVAAKYKGKANAEQRLYEHLTTGEVAHMSDGHEEFHKVIRSQSEEQTRNLVRWILTQ